MRAAPAATHSPKSTNKGDSSASPSQNTPTAEKQLQTNFPAIGLEFTQIPDVSGSERDALKTFSDVVRGLEQNTRTGKASPLVEENSSRKLSSRFQSSFKYLRKHNKHFTGSRRVSVAVAASKKSIVGFDICADMTDVKIVTDGKSEPASSTKHSAGQAIVTLGITGWQVTEFKSGDGTC